MWILYILGYLILLIITSIILRIIDNKIDIFDFTETPYVLGIFWPLALPISIVAVVGFGVYCLSEYLVKLIEEKLHI